MKEEQDIEALSMGSTKTFDVFFTLFYPKVKLFLLTFLTDEHEAEDLAQDTFVRLWQNRQLLHNVANLSAYIYQTAKHILYAYLDKRKNIFTTETGELIDIPSTEDIENIVYSHELEELLNRIIANMPLQRKQIFCMSRKQGLSINDIAQQLGLSKRTVDTHISLALATLRSHLHLSAHKSPKRRSIPSQNR